MKSTPPESLEIAAPQVTLNVCSSPKINLAFLAVLKTIGATGFLGGAREYCEKTPRDSRISMLVRGTVKGNNA